VVERLWEVADDVAGGFEPGREHRSLGLALGVTEVRGHERGAGDQAGVRGEDEVRHVLGRFHRHDLGARGPHVRGQGVPLRSGSLDVDAHLRVHPGVDLVEDAEVLRWAHEVAAAPWQDGHRATPALE
jgi:hypothetical protein